MKKFTLLFLLLLSGIVIAGTPTKISLVSATKTATTLEFISGDYVLKKVNTPQGEANIISIDKGTSLLVAGAPDLQKFTASVIVPDKAEMEFTVVKSNYYDVENVIIAPSKGNLKRINDPVDVPYTYGEMYSQDAFFPSSIATLNSPYILRDYRGQTISVCPFQYNAQTKVLRVYTDIVISVSVKNTNGGLNLLDRAGTSKIVDKEFEAIYQHQFLNYSAQKSSTRFTPVSGNGTMLIICYDAFSAAMLPLVDWKNRKGIATELVSKSVAGADAASIKTYITTYYSTHPNLKYVLLVGDAPQIPAATTNFGDSDNSYGYILGNDSYPELFVGRFSATTNTQVQTMVNRTINYEKTPDAAGTWYGKGITIGSALGPGDNNEYDFEHERNIRTKLMGYTYTDVSENYDGSQGGVDLDGDPDVATIAPQINDGTGIITYTGHGADYEFVTTNFTSSDVHALTNTNKTPFIWSVACVNGDFVNNAECFAEAWLRQGTPAQPKGAIGALMATINQSWNPPMKGQDAMVDILTESISGNIQRTFGGLSLNGCMDMNDAYQTDGFEMTDTWNLFGDPSVMVYTKTPVPMVTSHVASTAAGTISITVNCNTNGALICLSMNGTILGTGVSNGTSAVIAIPAATAGVIDVTATAFNKMPYFGTINVAGTTTGISQMVTDVAFNVYPVPANDKLNLDFNVAQAAVLKVTIINCIGQEVLQVSTESAANGSFSKSVDITKLETGVYFVKLETSQNTYTKRIIVNH